MASTGIAKLVETHFNVVNNKEEEEFTQELTDFCKTQHDINIQLLGYLTPNAQNLAKSLSPNDLFELIKEYDILNKIELLPDIDRFINTLSSYSKENMEEYLNNLRGDKKDLFRDLLNIIEVSKDSKNVKITKEILMNTINDYCRFKTEDIVGGKKKNKKYGGNFKDVTDAVFDFADNWNRIFRNKKSERFSINKYVKKEIADFNSNITKRSRPGDYNVFKDFFFNDGTFGILPGTVIAALGILTEIIAIELGTLADVLVEGLNIVLEGIAITGVGVYQVAKKGINAALGFGSSKSKGGNAYEEIKSGGAMKKKATKNKNSLDNCTVAELKEKANKRGVNVKGLKKAEIIAKLRR